MSLGICCPFCGEKLDIEYYSTGIKGKMGKTIVFCSNDNCEVKPCTDDTTPSKAIEEAKLFGKLTT
ncbi:MAG: hypothetical protein PHS54_07450 [Clostridia bacterium]|nr:hypothetical protein [Clostridia bacterium]